MKRRDFIKRTAIASGVIAVPTIVSASALGKDGFVAANDRIVMAGIGLGGMGRGDMSAFLRSKQVQYVALCDVDKRQWDKAQEILKREGFNDVRNYVDYRELLEKEELDAVHTALPDHWHAIPTIEAAKKGLDIYGQKPLARSIQESRAIVDAVEKYNIVWQTGSQQRSGGQFHRACELVRNGVIGEVKYVEVGLPNGGHKGGQPKPMPVPEGVDWDMWLGPAPKVPYRGVLHWDWRWSMDYSGGQLTDWAGHHIDIAKWGLGLERTGPVKIEAEGERRKNDIFNVPYAYEIECEYENGVEMRIANQKKFEKRKGKGWGKDKKQKDRIGMGAVWFGDEGWIHVNRAGIWAENPKVLDVRFTDNDIRLYRSRNHHQNFIECVRSRKETVAPAEIGHRSISVALLGEIAMAVDKKLEWDPKAERFTNNEKANDLLLRPYRSPWKMPKI
ncbi:MAG: Gfo/Idh/MocA family oxidoreductase [Draconibacterium sp.]|nr:Gfo/Idh/MocA family oxidoreductase [Draconibacterium sp.]